MSGSLSGKTCLVTGASTGIGRVIARGLAQQGASVVLVSRDAHRGQAALEDLRRASGNDRVELILGDLSVMAEVRRVAAAFRARHDRLHLLVNNAGVINAQRHVTADRYEATFALNHLAYFLLTNLLLDVIRASAPARIVNVASEAHRMGHIDFGDLQRTRRYGAWRVYGQSKLANLLFTYELARRLEGTGVSVNAVHPGAVASQFGAGATGLWGLGLKLARPFMLSTEQGAETALYLATSPEVEGISGKYFSKRAPIRSNRESYDTLVQRRLWEVSEQLTRDR